MIYVTYPKQKKQEVKRTGKKTIVTKKHDNKHKKVKVCIDKRMIQTQNNDTYIRNLVLRGFDKYEIHEKIRTIFKKEISYDYIESFIDEDKSVNIKFNENGDMRPNTETYHEVF